VGSIVYQSNFHFSNGLARYAANGWVLSGTATENTGFPFTAITSGNPSSCSTPTTTTTNGVSVTTGCGNVALAPFDGGATGGADNTNNSGSGTIARAPHVKRNGYSGPGIHNIDFRIGRDFPVFKTMKLQLQGEAFNLLNHRNGLAVANTGFSFVNPSNATSNTTCQLANHTNTCIAPYVSSPAFGQINSTSGTLYGARQLQVTAKLFF
jgi:hypothetical protein